MSHFDCLGLTKCPPVELSDPPSAKRHRSVNSRGRRRSMWACAFRATFISSISFIYLLILLYSHSFSKHCHSLHRETFEGGGTESFSENGQARRQVLARPQVDPIPLSRHPSVRGRTNWAAYTHTPQVQSTNKQHLDVRLSVGIRSFHGS